MEYDEYGLGYDEGYNSIYKLQCALGTCSWTKLNQELQTGRHAFIAVPIHDAWTACRPGEKVSKLADTTNICYGNDCFSDDKPSAANSDQYECDPDVIGALGGECVKKNVKRQQEYENLILFQVKDGN